VLVLLLLGALIVTALADKDKDDHHGHHRDKDDHHDQHKEKDDHHGHHKEKDDHDDHKDKDHGHHKSDDDDKHHGKRRHRGHDDDDDDHRRDGGHRHGRGRHDHEEPRDDEDVKDTDPEHSKEYDELDTRLNKITSRLQEIEDDLDDRLDPAKITKAHSLEHRVTELEEDHCDSDHYYCGREDPECVSRLHVCDGVNDCRSGDDEKHCELPLKVGDEFVGHVVFDNCTQRRPETVAFTITAIKTDAAFPGFPKVRATISIESETDDHEAEVALPTTGYYRFNSQNLILLPPEDDRLGLICDFDGHNKDRCVGNIGPETSLEACAQFIFFRHFDDEDDDHHESHDHH